MARAALVLGLNEGVTNCIEIGELCLRIIHFIEAIHYACSSNNGVLYKQSELTVGTKQHTFSPTQLQPSTYIGAMQKCN